MRRETVKSERKQLIDCWAPTLRRLIEKPPKALRALVEERLTPEVTTARLRKFHDKLGWQAWGKLEKGGLCAGTIYRTREFMQIQQARRRGSRNGQTVHIEHTVPICVLRDQWISVRESRDPMNFDFAWAWLLKHSVTTAMSYPENRQVKDSTSSCFSSASDSYRRPFRRYSDAPLAAGMQVWNVFDRSPIDLRAFTFEDHWRSILGALREAEAPSDFMARIEKAAEQSER
jgi:hypothetical protein